MKIGVQMNLGALRPTLNNNLNRDNHAQGIIMIILRRRDLNKNLWRDKVLHQEVLLNLNRDRIDKTALEMVFLMMDKETKKKEPHPRMETHLILDNQVKESHQLVIFD